MWVWNAFECWFPPRLVLGKRSSVCILALPLRPLYSSISLLSFLLFLGIPILTVQEYQSYSQFHICTFLSHIWLRTFVRFLIPPEELHLGVPNQTAILKDRAHQPFVSCFFYLLGAKFYLRNPRFLSALVQTLLTCVFHLKSFLIFTPRYLMPFGSREESFLRFLPYMCMVAILVMWAGPFEQTFVPPFHWGSTWNLASIGLAVSKKKKFGKVESEWPWTMISEWQWPLIFI